MPNIIAYAALFLWPLVAIWLFNNHRLDRAVIWGVVAPYVLLPTATGVDLPLIPDLNKTTIPNLMLLILAKQHMGKSFTYLPDSKVARFLLIVMIVSPVFTVLTNGDPLIFERGYIPGLKPYDAASQVVVAVLMVTPFLVGRACLADPEAHRELLKILVLVGLIHTIPMLMEIRLSPQINNWIYGFYPGLFMQQVRYGGFRPTVFMGHGLLVAYFAMVCVVAAAALWKSKLDDNGKYLPKMLWLLLVLILCKTLGALLYALLLVPLIMFMPPRTHLRVASIFVIIAVAYPALRGADMVPVDSMLEAAGSYSPERAHSLGFRFHHEHDLLLKASEKPLFGWGSWGRNHIHDPVTGAETSVTDGYWIIVIGKSGWVGYIAEFGLLAFAVLAIGMRIRREGPEILTPVTGGLCLLLGINMIELLPNATITPLTWLLAGALVGFAEQRVKAKSPAASETEPIGATLRPQRRRTVL